MPAGLRYGFGFAQPPVVERRSPSGVEASRNDFAKGNIAHMTHRRPKYPPSEPPAPATPPPWREGEQPPRPARLPARSPRRYSAPRGRETASLGGASRSSRRSRPDFGRFPARQPGLTARAGRLFGRGGRFTPPSAQSIPFSTQLMKSIGWKEPSNAQNRRSIG